MIISETGGDYLINGERVVPGSDLVAGRTHAVSRDKASENRTVASLGVNDIISDREIHRGARVRGYTASV